MRGAFLDNKRVWKTAPHKALVFPEWGQSIECQICRNSSASRKPGTRRGRLQVERETERKGKRKSKKRNRKRGNERKRQEKWPRLRSLCRIGIAEANWCWRGCTWAIIKLIHCDYRESVRCFSQQKKTVFYRIKLLGIAEGISVAGLLFSEICRNFAYPDKRRISELMDGTCRCNFASLTWQV